MSALSSLLILWALVLFVVVPLRGRIDPDEYERTIHPPEAGYGQAEGFFGWIPPVLLAPVVGAVAAVLAWNLWLLPVVTVAGAVLGVVVGFGGSLLITILDKYWLQLGHRVEDIDHAVLLIGGPATTVLVGVLALLYAPDLSLPLWLAGLLGGLVATVAWRVR